MTLSGVRSPIANSWEARHAGPELPQLRDQPRVQLGAHVDRNDADIPQVGLEDILPLDRHQVGDSLFRRLLAFFLNTQGVQIIADGPAAIPPGPRDDDPSISAAQIADDIVLCHPSHLQHPLDNVLRRRDEFHKQNGRPTAIGGLGGGFRPFCRFGGSLARSDAVRRYIRCP
jgi:hypothetical protein